MPSQLLKSSRGFKIGSKCQVYATSSNGIPLRRHNATISKIYSKSHADDIWVSLTCNTPGPIDGLDYHQTVDFPELNIKIKPKEGSFLFFSSILNHKSDKNRSLISKYAIPFNFNEKKYWE